jgi:hypothetical protein
LILPPKRSSEQKAAIKLGNQDDMAEITFIVDPSSGAIVVEDNLGFGRGSGRAFARGFGRTAGDRCARRSKLSSRRCRRLLLLKAGTKRFSVRVAGYYHDS